jgi:hypothetical protein
MSFNFDAEKNDKELLQTDEVKLDEFIEKDLELEPVLNLGEEAEEEPGTEGEEAGGTRDPISTYLRDIGSVPLLNREKREKSNLRWAVLSARGAVARAPTGGCPRQWGTRYTRSRGEI